MRASPDPGVVGLPHLDGVERSVQVHHIQSDDRVFLSGLKVPPKRRKSDRNAHFSAAASDSAYFRVVVLLPRGVRRAGEHG